MCVCVWGGGGGCYVRACVRTEAQDGETSCCWCYSEGVLMEGDVVACKVMVAVVKLQQQNWA